MRRSANMPRGGFTGMSIGTLPYNFLQLSQSYWLVVIIHPGLGVFAVS